MQLQMKKKKKKTPSEIGIGREYVCWARSGDGFLYLYGVRKRERQNWRASNWGMGSYFRGNM